MVSDQKKQTKKSQANKQTNQKNLYTFHYILIYLEVTDQASSIWASVK